MSSLMARMPDELLARCAGWLDTPTARRLAQVSRAGERLVLARLAAEKAGRAAEAAALVAAQRPHQGPAHCGSPAGMGVYRHVRALHAEYVFHFVFQTLESDVFHWNTMEYVECVWNTRICIPIYPCVPVEYP